MIYRNPWRLVCSGRLPPYCAASGGPCPTAPSPGRRGRGCRPALAIKGLLPIRLAQPRTTSCGWVVGVARSGRAETGTPPPGPAGGRGGPNWQPARHEATAAALLGREAVLRLGQRAGSRVEPRRERQRVPTQHLEPAEPTG